MSFCPKVSEVWAVDSSITCSCVQNTATDAASKFSAITKNVRAVNKYSKNISECLDQANIDHFPCESFNIFPLLVNDG